MKKIDWAKFKDDDEAIEYLKGLPRYKNTAVKSAFNRALFFATLIKCRLFGLNRPLFTVFVTNNKCNLNCSYCYGKYGERKQKDYSTIEFLKIIDELKDLGARLLTMHGGESLLRRDISEIFNYAKLKGFCISLNTNGYLVPVRIKEICCVDTVILSLDGRKESNDKNRGNGCYDKVMEAIEVLTENHVPVVVSATLTAENMQDMEYLAELAVEKNFRVQYSILYNYSAMKDKGCGVVMSDAEIRETIKKIFTLKKKGYPVYYSYNVLESAIKWPVSFEKRWFKKGEETIKNYRFVPCYHGRLKYQIDADGRVITCWAHDYADAPNVKERGVAGAIKECHDRNTCAYCAFLANNEHNALMHLSPRNILNIMRIQVEDAFKIKDKN